MPRYLRPHWLIVIPMFVSAAVWLFPWPHGWRRGFTVQEPVTVQAVALLAAWYGTLFLASFVGYLVGREHPPLARLETASPGAVYRWLGRIALIGVLWTYGSVQRSHPGLLMHALQTSQFNEVRDAVPFSAGPATLRYAAIIAGAIGAFRLVVGRDRRLIHIRNVLLLVLAAAVASRLSLLVAVLLFIGLTINERDSLHLSRGAKIFGILTVFGLLTAMNYVRNANTYRVVYGASNPVKMSAYEAVAYLGAPFQVSMGTGNKGTDDFPGLADGIRHLFLPTYASSRTNVRTTPWYRNLVDVEPSLTTNSTLADAYGWMGLWCIPLVGVVCFVAAILVGHASLYRGYFGLTAYVVGYCFAEIWRTYLFSQGIIQFLVLLLVLIPALTTVGWRGEPAAARV